MKILVLLSTLLFLSGCKHSSDVFDTEININDLLVAHNNERMQHGLSPLILNENLTKAAQKHAEWMAQKNKLSHTGAKRSSPGDRMRSEGYIGTAWAENIATSSSLEKVMNLWMESKGHRADILGHYHDVGFGVAKSNNITYWVVDFADPENFAGLVRIRKFAADIGDNIH